MTNVSAVIVISFGVGEIHEVVEQEGYWQREDDQCGLCVAVHGWNVESDACSVENSHEEVHSLEFSRFEFLLELTEALIGGKHQGEGHYERNYEGHNRSEGSELVEFIILGSIGEVNTRWVREVEAVEQNQSQQHLLYEPLWEIVKSSCAPFNAVT